MNSQVLESFDQVMEIYNTQSRVTRPLLSRYEKTKIIGLRLEQLARGAPPTIDTTGHTSIRSIALAELEQRKLPFMIVRSLPNSKEYWMLEDMIL